jgi:hypothetical protein
MRRLPDEAPARPPGRLAVPAVPDETTVREPVVNRVYGPLRIAHDRRRDALEVTKAFAIKRFEVGYPLAGDHIIMSESPPSFV